MKKKHLWIIAAFLMKIFMTSQIAMVKTPVLESYILKCKVLNDRSSIADYLILAESTNLDVMFRIFQ